MLGTGLHIWRVSRWFVQGGCLVGDLSILYIIFCRKFHATGLDVWGGDWVGGGKWEEGSGRREVRVGDGGWGGGIKDSVCYFFSIFLV